MKDYNVTITETLQMTVTVKADDRAEAEEIVEERWDNSEYVLDSSHFKGADFEAEEGEPEQKRDTIRVLVIKPNAEPEVCHIGKKLEDIQELVGGNIECMHYYDEVAIVCNKEGKINNFPLNRAIRDEDGEVVDIIAGDFFICNAPATSDTFESLTDKQVKKYQETFKNPERFQRTANGIKVIPHKPKSKNWER